jgi:hypothetical protein
MNRHALAALPWQTRDADTGSVISRGALAPMGARGARIAR